MIILPDSIQELVGRKIERIFTSHPDLDQVVFDLETTSANRRIRYAYEIDGRISRIQNLSNMVGYTVLEIRPLTNELDGTNKFAIFTEAIGQFGIIYFTPFSGEEDSFITEGGSVTSYEWQPISEENLEYDFTVPGEVEAATLNDGVVSFEGDGSAGDWQLILPEGHEATLRVTSLAFNFSSSGETAEFEWATGPGTTEVQANESGVDDSFLPSPFEMNVVAPSDSAVTFTLDPEITAEYSFLIEVWAEVITPEPGEDLVQEDESDCSCLMLESHHNDSEAELIDLSMNRQPPFNSAIQYIVQEDDVRFLPTSTESVDTCPCDDDEEEET